ncbi:hypothetical protein O3M35_006253 [Rhynocoris fuscipes]|uniref:HTH OST-type domain-containing protein n=1 Tax=Rhynocoris fuscipes TaxID=488301 RepID=A0AAW1DCQ6_9HEMI
MDEWVKCQLPNTLNNQENVPDLDSAEKSFLPLDWKFFTKDTNLSKNRSILASKNDNDLRYVFEKGGSECISARNDKIWGDEYNEFKEMHEKCTNLSILQQPRNKKKSQPTRHLTKNVGILRKSRTPPPFMLTHKGNFVPSSSRNSANTDDTLERHKLPYSSNGGSSVELHVTHLDQSIDPTDMKKILFALFGEHVMVLHISVFVQSDGNLAALVKVPSMQDAQYAISQLHRRKVGHKKIMISHGHSGMPQSPQFIRWQVVSLLKEVPGFKLPLFKFLEMFESRYVNTISLSDLYRLKDVCVITDESSGRMVSLQNNLWNTPSPCLTPTQDVEPYCMKHYKIRVCPDKGWAEQEVPPLPNVMVSLSDFSTNILHLLKTHDNILPLSSLCDCYIDECGPLTFNESGVPLEHLVTCIGNVELAVTNGVKYLKLSSTANGSNDSGTNEDMVVPVNPSLAEVLALFGKELVEILKTQTHCQLLFNRFIPAYHHHFGRQCRVADYGFTKLIDLLEALPNIIQVIGEGNKRIVTLSHRAQIRRFTSDVLRTLKTQPYKRMPLSELSAVFERILGKPFDPVDYGLCYLLDLVGQLKKTAVLVIPSHDINDIILAIPKREQTPSEIERTRQFAKEVVELLGLAPHCSILFNKFIPAYHHHYGHQCRVANFGFTKLIELFEAIPDIVQLEEDSEGERKVTLTHKEKIRVLGEQICELVTPSSPPGLPLSSLESAFLWHYGYSLKPSVYSASTLTDLIMSLSTVMLVDSDIGKVIVPVEQQLIKHLISRVKRLLITSDEGKMCYSKLKCSFSNTHEKYISSHKLQRLLPEAIQVIVENKEEMIVLTPLYQLVRRICLILMKNYGQLSLSLLETLYHREYQSYIQPREFGFSNLQTLLCAMPDIFVFRERGPKKNVLLNKDILQKNTKAKEIQELYLSREDSELFSFETSQKTCNIPVVNLPEFESPADTLTFSSLISPCKGLLPPSARPSFLLPPHPSQLPSPNYLLSNKGNQEDEYEFESVKNNLKRNCAMVDDFPLKTINNKVQDKGSSPKKRRIRLAAQFETPFDFS